MVTSQLASLRLFQYGFDSSSDGNLPTRIFAFAPVRLFFRLGIVYAVVPVLFSSTGLMHPPMLISFSASLRLLRYGYFPARNYAYACSGAVFQYGGDSSTDGNLPARIFALFFKANKLTCCCVFVESSLPLLMVDRLAAGVLLLWEFKRLRAS